jgi:hypothetical protein
MAQGRKRTSLVPIERQIIVCRGARVILDENLSAIYGVSTKRLNEQVRRNRDRFPEDFCFQLTGKELESIRSQIATASKRNVRYPPLVFTEHGAIMAANVLKTKRAVEMSVFVVRAFVRLREVALAHQELAAKLNELEQKVGRHDADIQTIIKALRQLMQPPEPPKRPIGFRVEEPKVLYRIKRKR